MKKTMLIAATALGCYSTAFAQTGTGHTYQYQNQKSNGFSVQGQSTTSPQQAQRNAQNAQNRASSSATVVERGFGSGFGSASSNTMPAQRSTKTPKAIKQ